jgi:predicted branched-subunit amino acid permease
LGKKTSNKNIYSLRFFLPILFAVLIASSCNPTKYVPAGRALLVKNHISINNPGVKEADLVPYIKQKPNKKIL